MKLGRYNRELSATVAYAALLAMAIFVAPSFFSTGNLRDLALNNAPLLLMATGMTMVVLVGEIDISVGSQFAVCSVVAGGLAKVGVPVALLLPCLILVGGAMGAVNGLLVGWLRLPSIIVTLAMLVAWREGLRWITQGAWVQNLPATFQWFGLGQSRGQLLIVLISLVVFASFTWILRSLGVGRAIYAAGSNQEASRLAGIEPRRVVFRAFVLMGAFTGLAALLNAMRFNLVPSNAGLGLELKVIAAVVVGGTAITGGRGTLVGTLIGVALLGTIGTALTFAGINPFWEKAIQGGIILAALVSDVAFDRFRISRFGFPIGNSR
jgi:rhamnose transport system permease protein